MSNESTPYPIPQTNALKQVSHQSLQEMFSRDPESLGDDIWSIVAHMHDLRDRLAATATVRQVRVKKEPSDRAPLIPHMVASASEMGFVKKKVNPDA